MANGLDNTVFTAPQPRDYVGHAIEINKMFPDYGQKIQQALRSQAEQQALALKYKTDLQKAQAYIDLYPEYRDAQIAELKARAAKANAEAQYSPDEHAAKASYWRARAATSGTALPPEVADILNEPMPTRGGAGVATTPGAEPPTAPAVAAPIVDTGTVSEIDSQ